MTTYEYIKVGDEIATMEGYIVIKERQNEGRNAWVENYVIGYDEENDCDTEPVKESDRLLTMAEIGNLMREVDGRKHNIRFLPDDQLDLKGRRMRAGLTQKELSEAAGISIKTLQDYESGRYNFNGAAASTVKKIAEALGCRMEDLID